MISIEQPSPSGFASLSIQYGNVNAIRLDLVQKLDAVFGEFERDDDVHGVVLTATGPFFSFGFDVPHFLGQPRDELGRFLRSFTDLYTRLFLFPKPLIAALNGHAVAGGWMLAQPCDARILARGNTKVGLNEVRFGAALFAGSLDILRHLAGGSIADRVAGSGAFYGPEEALGMGLVDELCDPGDLPARALALAEERFAAITQPSFSTIRALIRAPVAESYREREHASIERFMDIWFTDAVQATLAKILIRE